MNPLLTALLDARDGIVTYSTVDEVIPRWMVEKAYRRGELVRLLPGVFGDPDRTDDPVLRWRAALAYADGRGVLSHITTAAVWRLHDPDPGEPIHLTVPMSVRLRSRPELVVHAAKAARRTVVRDGLRVTRMERTLVDAWSWLTPDVRRAAVIRAVNDRLTTPERVSAVLSEAPRVRDRSVLRTLLDQLAAGCRSPLEIWGLDHVFRGPGMPEFRRQERVRVGGRTFYLDVYAPAERVAFELDGATAHASKAQREIDLRRDAALATLGILVVRFSHRRLVTEPDAVRAEVLTILAARRSP